MFVHNPTGGTHQVGREGPLKRQTSPSAPLCRWTRAKAAGTVILAAIMIGCGGRADVEANTRPKGEGASAGSTEPPAPTTPPNTDQPTTTPASTPLRPVGHKDAPGATNREAKTPPPASPPTDLDYGPLDLGERFDVEGWRDGTAFVAAYDRIAGDADIPGKLSDDDVAKLAQSLATGPNATGVANGIGATVRIAETGTLKPGTEAAVLAKAMASGASRYTFDGRKKATHPTESEWKQIMAAGGVEERVSVAFLRQPAANVQAAKDKRLDVFARLLQGELHVVPALRSRYKFALARSLPEDLRPLGDELAQLAAVALLTSIPPDKIHEPDRVAEVWASAMEARKVPEAKIDLKALRLAAADGYGSVNQYTRTHPAFNRYRSAAGLILMHHKVILDEALKECE